jgi:ketosteroid isomerase-like protein
MSRENLALIREGYARWRAGDWEFFVANAAPDVELYSRFGSLTGEPYRGPDGVRAWFAELRENFERFDAWLDDLREAGDDRVVALGGISFRARGSGIDMDERLGWVFELRNGRVRRMLFYSSPSEALEAVGLRE